MYTVIKHFVLLLIIMTVIPNAHGQGMQMGEVVILTIPKLRDGISHDAFKTYIKDDVVPAWKNSSQQGGLYLFQADRGNKKGEFLVVYAPGKTADLKTAMPGGSPFTLDILTENTSTKPAEFLENPETFTEYHLLGAEKFSSLPEVGILGIHFIKVKSGSKKDFEKFAIDKMHPVVGSLLPDMQLLTYKAVAGDQNGSYITIFAIESVAARDQYWPAGKPETERLKQAFQPHQELARALENYLEPGSYLEPSKGAAAIFESKEWTDFIHIPLN